MSKRIFSGILVSLLLIGILTLAFNIRPVRAAASIVYIINPCSDGYPSRWNASTARGLGSSNFTFYSNETAIGSTFFVNVTVANVTALKGWDLGVVFDNTTLKYMSAWRPTDHVFSGTEADGTSMTAPAVVITDFDATHQEAQWGCTYLMPDPPWTFNGTGVLCQIQFRTIAEVNSTRPQVSSSFTFDPPWTAIYYQPTGYETPLLGAGYFDYFSAPTRAEPITVPDDYPTIQEAINNANEGDTVFVRSGVYQQRVILNKTLSLVGENRETTVLDWGVVIEADRVSVSGFTMHANGPSSGDQIGCNYGVWVMSSNCLITNNVMSDSPLFYGIFLDGGGGHVVGNVIANNDILNNSDCGILLWNCNNSIIRSNVVKGNKYFGIYVCWYSCENSIVDNEVSDSSWNGIIIEDYSSANLVINNTVLNNGFIAETSRSGICLTLGASSNQIVGNNLTGNTIGLYQSYDSNDNTIYHNAFVNNGLQVNYDLDFPCKNAWDDGYPSGGNYWSDYAGKDLFGGPYQNVTGSDGIGDTWRILDVNNTDRYPLMKPFVPLLGDLNGDNIVNMQDVIVVLDAFGSYLSHPRWNPIADMNSDGRIDMGDIIIVLTNFGQHYP